MSNGNSKENPDKEEEGEDTGEIQGGVGEETRRVEVSETVSRKEWLRLLSLDFKSIVSNNTAACREHC